MVEVAEKEDFKRALVNLYLEKKDNNAFFNQYLSKKSFSKEKYNSDEEKWDDNNKDDNSQVAHLLWIDFGATIKAKNKLIRILKGESLILQQQCSL